jgi:hypothetical protein
MTQPTLFPDPASSRSLPGDGQFDGGPGRAVGVWLAVVAGTALLGVVAGFLWAAVAPRALLVVVSRGSADVVNSETSAFIAADGLYCLICLAGGVLSGWLGYVLAVRRQGPAGMVAVLLGGLAAGLLALWIGQQSGLATYQHLLATLPAGAHLRARLTLGARAAIGFWPLAAGLIAGGIELTGAMRDRRQAPASQLVLGGPGSGISPPG